MRLALVLSILIAACGPGSRHTGGDDSPQPDSHEPDCVDAQHRCSASTYQVCSGGMWQTQQECSSACDEGLGCVECVPGAATCGDDGNVHSCTPAGELGDQTMACDGALICQTGACVDACANAAMQKSYTGCEYWAVDLDNAIEVYDGPTGATCTTPTGSKAEMLPNVCKDPTGITAGACDLPNSTCPSGYTCQAANVCVFDAQHAPFAIVVSNPEARPVDVTVTGPEGTAFTQTIAAGEVASLKPQDHGIPDESVEIDGVSKKAYKVTSTLPIVAYQFNPLDNVGVFSNDASLLVPRTAFDLEYYVLSYQSSNRRTQLPGKDGYLGYLTVVAYADGTTVDVTPTVQVVSGTGMTLAANTTGHFTLDAFEVLTLHALGSGDITGSKVTATGTNTVGVFSGHEAAGFGEPPSASNPFLQGPCCADHLEDMMFPTSTWGKEFGIARSQDRGAMEPDMIRVMAQKPNTNVTFDPPPTGGGNCMGLTPGKFCEVKIQKDTSITATEPVLVGHYLESAIYQDALFGDTIGEGDPSLAVAVPSEQWRKDYTVLVPAQYPKNFLSIAAPSTGAVLVDGTMQTLTTFGNYKGGRFAVQAGSHKITCPASCSVTVYGYGDAVSYMFAGGLDLKHIVIQ
ncbi:MAG TPA: IgGFc-binding protein [Kofleriaceae bacterium]